MSTSESPPGGQTEPTDLLGTVVAGRYLLARLVSAGANTTVFDAADGTTGRTVTVKLIRPDVAATELFRERFDDTMRSVAALSHPNIAALYDWGVAAVDGESTPYVVVEQLTGGSLRDMFDRARQLSPSQALAVGLDACRALDYAHRRGFVHSELTPSKIVFGDDRRLRITDFGLAGLLNAESWRRPESVATHTAWYASPEQGTGRPIDGKTDVYALCLTLHEAVTGTLPFKSDSTVASFSARVGRLMPVSADLGPLAAVLEHAGRPEPDERASASEFGRELVRAASKLPRPEPLPLLSTGLFDTPAEQMRSPEDPTGGVVRPATDEPEPPVIVEQSPEPGAAHERGDDLVILPLDSDIPEHARAGSPPVDDGVGGADAAVDESEPDDGPPVEPLPDESLVDESLHLADVGTDVDGDADDGGPVALGETPLGVDPGVTAEMTAAAPHMYDETPARRRRFPWKIVLSLLVVAALVVLGLVASRLFVTPTYIVPDLVEMPEAEARNLVAPNRWEVTVERERSDLVPVVGRVVRTAPQSGVELAEGEPFLIVVSEGPTLRELPESTGMLLAEAQTRLLERGLDVRTTEQFDEVVPINVVISWSVPGDATLVAGALVEPETPVELVVSLGPAPRTVPDLVDHTVGAARAKLEELGLTLTESSQQFSDDIALGSIIAQSIEPGVEVERGTDVAVVVSRGPDIVPFPDLSAAATYEEAAEILVAAGFEPRLTFGDAQGRPRTVLIDGAEPAVGETFRRGTQVDISAL